MRQAAVAIAVLTALRAFAAFHVPLTADEAYYWSWSLHPAFGYTDHPPLVAWLIWLGTKLGGGAGFVRLPFVLCEAVAAIAIGRAAAIVSGSPRAGAIAAMLFALIPQTKLALGEALPDGGYIAAWGLSLWAAAAFDRRPSRTHAVALGAALAATVLARDFGWALVFGVVAWLCEPERRKRAGAAGIGLVLLVLAIGYAPFVVWNATNGWENVVFSLHLRQQFAAGEARLGDVSTLRFAAYALLLVLATWFVALRSRPRHTLVAWTALPLPAALFVFSFFTTTESYWIVGPAASLALGAGIALDRAVTVLRVAVIGVLGIGTAYVTAAALFLTLPEAAQAAAFAAVPALRAPLSSGVFVYQPLASHLRSLAAADHDAVILTDRYETAAELLWYGLDSRIVVPLPQQAQWMRWHAGEPVPQHALLVTYREPAAANPGLAAAAAAAYAHAQPLAGMTFTYAGLAEDPYDVERLDDPRANARAVMPGL